VAALEDQTLQAGNQDDQGMVHDSETTPNVDFEEREESYFESNGKFATIMQRAQERLVWSRRPADELVTETASALQFVCCQSTCQNEMCKSYNAIVEAMTAVAKAESAVAKAESAVAKAEWAVAEPAVVAKAESAVATVTMAELAEDIADFATPTTDAEQIHQLKEQLLQAKMESARKDMEAAKNTLEAAKNTLEAAKNTLEDKETILKANQTIFQAKADKIKDKIKFFSEVVVNAKQGGNQTTYQTQRTGASLMNSEAEEAAGTAAETGSLTYVQKKLEYLIQKPYVGPS
jgi:hypothetical protein